jgi:phosphomethylpyrimidine synthase
MNVINKPTENSGSISVTTGPIVGSKKIYIPGDRHPDIRVPMREIDLDPSAKEPPVRVYDTSGPYSDPKAVIDITAGLPRLREPWIRARGDVETYDGRSVRAEDNGHAQGEHLVPQYPSLHRPMRAKAWRAVTQLAYARTGIVTPEMEFIAIRENIGRAKRDGLIRDGEDFGA